MTLGLILTSFTLGLRHGFDWDHIAAIADLNSATDNRRRGFLLSLYYALGHAAVVMALGTMLIVAGATIPESLDEWMGRIVGITLIVLGIAVVWDLVRNRGAVRLRSRWMLILEGTFAGLRHVRRRRGRRTIEVSHVHEHDHDGDIDHAERAAHDHTHDHTHDHARDRVHDTAGASVPQPAVAGGRSTSRAERLSRRHGHRHAHQLELPVDRPVAAAGAATGIGMLHGVGIESPTQIAIFVASTSVVGTAGGLTLLAGWVVGLIIANAILAAVAGSGILRPGSNTWVVRAIAIVVATASIGLGTLYVIG